MLSMHVLFSRLVVGGLVLLLPLLLLAVLKAGARNQVIAKLVVAVSGDGI
jgi:hypothetical protein